LCFDGEDLEVTIISKENKMGLFKRLRTRDIDNDNGNDRVARRREAASRRRQERAVIIEKRGEVASHRKWSFISMAVIAVVVAALYYSGAFTSLMPMVLEFLKGLK
jgi:cytochrome c-type biogenesis protein CcmH/NrfG